MREYTDDLVNITGDKGIDLHLVSGGIGEIIEDSMTKLKELHLIKDGHVSIISNWFIFDEKD